MPEKVKVVNVKDPRDWESDDHKIKLTFYTLDILRNGTTQEVDHSRQQGKPAPQPGEELEVVFEPGKYREKMKKAPSAGGGKREWQPEAQRDPERSARILRQHSQDMALRVLGPKAAGEDESTYKYALEAWANYFDADVNKAGQAAVQGAGAASHPTGGSGSGSRNVSPAPAPEQRPVDLSECEQALDTAGMLGAPGKKVAEFMVTQLPPERVEKAIRNLTGQDIGLQSKTLKALKAETEAWSGPLPADDPDEGIPF